MSTPDGPVLIALSPSELATKTLTTHTLQRALRALHADGLVALTNAVSPTHLDALDATMQRDAAVLAARPGTHHNFGAATGNIQQEPPTTPALVFGDVVANPVSKKSAISVVGGRGREDLD